MRHLLLLGRELIWDAREPFPQRNLCKFLINERGLCRCEFGCWESRPCPRGCQACAGAGDWAS